MTDRTSKILFASIALGLWANITVVLTQPRPANAQYEADYILKSIDGHLSKIDLNIERNLKAQYETDYILKSIDGHLSKIDLNIERIQGGACANGKLCS